MEKFIDAHPEKLVTAADRHSPVQELPLSCRSCPQVMAGFFAPWCGK